MHAIIITEVNFTREYVIVVRLSNGHRISYDLRPGLMTARFRDLEDYDLFGSGKVINGLVIRWNANTELSLDEILLELNFGIRNKEVQKG